MDGLQRIFDPATDSSSAQTARALIRQTLLTQSRYIQTANFIRCSDADVRTLFDQYDTRFFYSQLRPALDAVRAWPMEMGFSGRLRSTGGRTTMYHKPGKIPARFAIHLSSNVLFNNFRTPEETASVVGLTCTDRLDALMRLMEHEMLHLAEFLAFGQSDCSAPRFQSTAKRMFGHAAHTHSMITKRVAAIRSTNFRPGHRVRFDFEGRQLTGMINRINTRATVLVEDPRGLPYSDGKRYTKFYIPIAWLEAA